MKEYNSEYKKTNIMIFANIVFFTYLYVYL